MMGDGLMNSSNMMMGWGGMFFGPITMIGILVLIVLGIAMLVKWMSDSSSSSRSSNQALSILQERFAAGDIDETEYQNRKRQLLA